MKPHAYPLVLVVVVALAATVVPSLATDPSASVVTVVESSSEAAADHLAIAAQYEGTIADLQALITEHQDMKRSYRQQYHVNKAITPRSKFAGAQKHSYAIIRDAGRLESDLEQLVTWHMLRAAELQGK